MRRRLAPLALLAGALACAAPGAAPGPAAAAAAAAGPEVDLVPVKGGCYRMGAAADDCDATPDERPAHEVCVGDFELGRHEVTQGQWRAVMGRDGGAASGCARPDCPVDDVTFDEVQEFLRRLNARGGARTFRLPTEAEWEYAARSGGRDERHAGGRDLDGSAWYADNSGKRNHPVGQKRPNGLGLFDMSGNVWELTSDWYDAGWYARSPRQDPPGPPTGTDRVVRGGSRSESQSNQRTTRRAALLDRTRGAGHAGNVGLRLAATPARPAANPAPAP